MQASRLLLPTGVGSHCVLKMFYAEQHANVNENQPANKNPRDMHTGMKTKQQSIIITLSRFVKNHENNPVQICFLVSFSTRQNEQANISHDQS